MNPSSLETTDPLPTRHRDGELTTRRAVPADAASIWRFVQRGDALESNSAYAYVLLSDHFRDTCWVTLDGDALAGFVAAYRPPRQPDTVFVWQVGVGAEWRGRGVAGELLHSLADGCGPQVRYLEATVTPDNAASERLFRGFARRKSAALDVSEGYGASLFPDGRSQPERLFRIGPFGGEK
jgi:L-2,4-diaminobutyric acid acetyltransferase